MKVKGRVSGLVAALFVLVPAVFGPSGAEAQKRAASPSPYVSNALDAVLLPVTTSVVQAFNLPKSASGVVIASVQPGGIADLYGMDPGEVITSIAGKQIRRPVDLDSLVRYNLSDDGNYFYMEGLRKGKPKRTIVWLEPDDYSTTLPVREAPRWRGYRGEYFDYVTWFRPYWYEIEEIYTYSYTYVEEVIVTDIFISTVSSSESYFYYDYTEITSVDIREDWVSVEEDIYCGDVTGYGCGVEEIGYPDADSFDPQSFAETGEEDVGGDYCSAFPDDPYCTGEVAEATDCGETPDAPDCLVEEAAPGDYGTGEEGDGASDGTAYDDPVYDDTATDETDVAGESGYDDTADGDLSGEESYDEPDVGEGYEEESYDEPVADDASGEESYDEPVVAEGYEEGSYDEPSAGEESYDSSGTDEAYEEPAYEEPAAEEPVYDEPAYDGGGEGGGECYFDEDGVEICP